MALDSCHDQMVNALIKAGWQVDPKTYYIEVSATIVSPDIRARQANGTLQQIIIVEVKCFADENADRDEIYQAIGQYLIYRNVLRLKPISAALYLAIPLAVYKRVFLKDVISATINEAKIKLLVVDIDREEIVQWLD